MRTYSSMLSSLAIAALATVTLNSSAALAKGGIGGMRSFSAARTSMVVNKINTVSPATIRSKLATPEVTRKFTPINPGALPPPARHPAIKSPPMGCLRLAGC